MDLGLYSNYSYLLQSITEYDATLNRIAEAGGISVLLGKSFDTVERVESDAIEDFNNAKDKEDYIYEEDMTYEKEPRIHDGLGLCYTALRKF